MGEIKANKCSEENFLSGKNGLFSKWKIDARAFWL